MSVVCMGSCLICDKGLAPSTLVVIPKGTAFQQGKPVATIMDNIPFANIPPFGMCTSNLNPAVMAAKMPVPCTPVTPAPWMPPFPFALSPIPTVTKGSSLLCLFGGRITIA